MIEGYTERRVKYPSLDLLNRAARRVVRRGLRHRRSGEHADLHLYREAQVLYFRLATMGRDW